MGVKLQAGKKMRDREEDYLIEQLHEDKAVEDQGVVHRGSVHKISAARGHAKDGVRMAHQRIHHPQLKYTLPHNGLYNLRMQA